MARRSSAMKFGTAFAAVSLLASSAASAAPRTVDPLLALSVFASQESRAAVCAAGVAAAAAAGAAAAQAAPAAPGCVLPVVDAAPPVVDTAPPPVVAPPIIEEGGKGIGMLPLLLGLAAITAAALLLLDNDDDDDEDEVPVSPE